MRARRVQAAKLPWAFTDRHAELAYAAYFDDATHLAEVDWPVMPLQNWGGDSGLKERRQTEFLVHDFCPWPLVEEVVVRDAAAQQLALSALSAAAHRPPVNVRPDWYY